MPVSSSIHWKPLRDSHYIVASLEPGGGGRRELFINQAALSQTQALAQRAFGQHAIGLLLGNRYECPNSGTSYVLIESLVSGIAAPDEDSFGPTISNLLDQFQGRDGLECVGWYCGMPSVGSRPSATVAALHTVVFPEPWQMLLAVSDTGDAGAFFLHDKRASRWFLSPFREAVESSRNRPAAMPTCIAWQTYMTTDATTPPPPVSTLAAALRRAAPPPATVRTPAPPRISAPPPTRAQTSAHDQHQCCAPRNRRHR